MAEIANRFLARERAVQWAESESIARRRGGMRADTERERVEGIDHFILQHKSRDGRLNRRMHRASAAGGGGLSRVVLILCREQGTIKRGEM